MKLLREYIRTLLTEGAKSVDDVIANDMTIVVFPVGDGAKIYYGTATGGTALRDDPEIYTNPSALGSITVEKYPPGVFGACDNAFIVAYSDAKHGWGPLLYDVAIEWATLNGGGLTPDRQAVSYDAENVWRYYMQNRGDVKSHQLDDMKNTLTPDDKDNCDQSVARQHSYRTGPSMIGGWEESYFSKRWTKAPTVINALKAAEKLVDHT